MNDAILVTGGSGLIAGHCIVQLARAGHLVRTTIRSLGREKQVRRQLAAAGLPDQESLEVVAADLLDDEGWDQALGGVHDVLHVASPVAPGHVDDERSVIVPARDGALRVLRAARAAGARRVVLTSAFHAVGWGHPRDGRVFTEQDWTDVAGADVDAYGKSKTLAERAAWEFVEREGGPELVTLLPVAVMGPVIGESVTGANHVVQMLLTGKVPAMPHVFFPIVDVRDVAAAHVLALRTPSAAGQRFLLSNGPALEMSEIARILRADLGDAARRVPTRTIPNAVVRLAGRFNAQMREVAPDLGYAKRTSNERACTVLGWRPRPAREAVVDAARSMLDHQLA